MMKQRESGISGQIEHAPGRASQDTQAAQTARTRHIPRSQRELEAAVSGGGIVRITFPLGKGENYGLGWALFYESSGLGGDTFIMQMAPTNLIAAHSSERINHGYDRRKGIVLSELFHEGRVISPGDGEYNDMAGRLKEAGLWEEGELQERGGAR